MYFASGIGGQPHVYKAIRSDRDSLFGTAEVMPFPAGYSDPTISFDGKTMLLFNNSDLYISDVPEPATFLLLGLGARLCLMASPRRAAIVRRRRS
jgi:hypothetical protein